MHPLQLLHFFPVIVYSVFVYKLLETIIQVCCLINSILPIHPRNFFKFLLKLCLELWLFWFFDKLTQVLITTMPVFIVILIFLSFFNYLSLNLIILLLHAFLFMRSFLLFMLYFFIPTTSKWNLKHVKIAFIDSWTILVLIILFQVIICFYKITLFLITTIIFVCWIVKTTVLKWWGPSSPFIRISLRLFLMKRLVYLWLTLVSYIIVPSYKFKDGIFI